MFPCQQYSLHFMYRKRAARNKMYGTVAMTPDDDTLQFNNDEGNNVFLELLSSMFVMFLIFSGPLYSDDNDDMPLDLNS